MLVSFFVFVFWNLFILITKVHCALHYLLSFVHLLSLGFHLDSVCHGSLASEPDRCFQADRFACVILTRIWITPALMKRAIGENELWSI